MNDADVSPFEAITAVDYTVIFVRDMAAMRQFYETVMRFRLSRTLSENWFEYQIGPNTLALARPRPEDADDTGSTKAKLQLAFKLAPAQVDAAAGALVKAGVELVSPPTNHDFGHRTVFFRDPDGNLLEIYAEI